MHAKYVDDITVAEALNLKEVLHTEKENKLRRPLNFHQRTEQILKEEDSQVAQQLKEISEYASTNECDLDLTKPEEPGQQDESAIEQGPEQPESSGSKQYQDADKKRSDKRLR